MRISASALLVCVIASAAAYPVINERLGGFRGPEVIYGGSPYVHPHATYIPETVIVEERIVERPVFEEVHRLPEFGYDNYGNAIPQHPFAYINDAAGTRAIEDAATVRSAPAVVPNFVAEPFRPIHAAAPRPYVHAIPEIIVPEVFMP